jgi:hypothetical protein
VRYELYIFISIISFFLHEVTLSTPMIVKKNALSCKHYKNEHPYIIITYSFAADVIMFPKISALSLVLPAGYLDNRLSAAKAREVNNNECRISPSVHALYFYRSSWPFLRILLPSSLSVCLSSRFFAIGYYCKTRSASCSSCLQIARLIFRQVEAQVEEGDRRKGRPK